ncbi:MAG: glycosyl hydrolase family 65 protein, partial [Thiobacillus sp.]
NTWPGHDGMAAFTVNKDGSKTYRNGHGMGDNYYDILPFGGDDMYATTEYYSALQSMIAAEEAILAHPEWAIPRSSLTFDPMLLRTHAAAVKKTVNKKFWDKSKGRFVGCIDTEGKSHDYGFIFVNMNAIYYGLATDEHAKQIMDWIDGRRIVKGDTSVGADIYKFRFGPRLSTKRNLDWYGGGWRPEVFEWGYQVQDGGAVLGFSYYDMMSRLKVYGADDAWKRLKAILQWDRDAWAAGGYREYYKDGKQGNTLQGGGTAGGLGIDYEFYESSLVPSIVIYGFLGIDPDGAVLRINPNLPTACPEMEARNVLYHNMKLDVKASNDRITIRVQESPLVPIKIVLDGTWQMDAGGRSGSEFEIGEAGTVVFSRR